MQSERPRIASVTTRKPGMADVVVTNPVRVDVKMLDREGISVIEPGTLVVEIGKIVEERVATLKLVDVSVTAEREVEDVVRIAEVRVQYWRMSICISVR